MSSTNPADDSDRMSGRPHCHCPAWLIEAWQDLVFRSEKRAAVIAERMGVSEDLLYAYATTPTNLSGKHRCPRMNRILPATLAAENYVLIHALANQAGLTTPRLKKAMGDTAPELLARSIRQFSALLGDYAAAMERGDDLDVQHFQRQAKRLREVLDQFCVTRHLHQSMGVVTHVREESA